MTDRALFSSLLLVGCGKMGGALLSGWLRQDGAAPDAFTVIEPHLNAAQDAPGVRVAHSLETLEAGYAPGCVVFAVKPQTLPSVLPAYAERFRTVKPLYISIAAGKTTQFFENALGHEAAIVRAMPNTPALIGKGITALYANGHVSRDQKHKAEALMRAVGDAVWAEHEASMDAITALSGSGPAYVFLFLESLIAAGIDAGLAPETARTLALETVRGSAELAATSPETLDVLRRNVTSPGGTTEAALEVLTDTGGLPALIRKAVARATTRSRELSVKD